MIDKIKNTLPNFPDEVIDTWLLPFAISEGWPPEIGSDGVPLKRWKYLLTRKPLRHFQTMKWAKKKKHISINEIEGKSQLSLIQIFEGAVLEKYNLMSASIPDLKERFNNSVDYIRLNGNIPKAPILYYHNNGKYESFDGNHRLAAYYYSYGYFNTEVDSNLKLNTKKEQTYWIASH